MTYYLPQTKATFKIIRTVACDATNVPIVSTAVTPTITHTADFALGHSLDLAKLKGQFSDTDLKFDFYEDGRLKGINASTTGQGETILKTVVSVVTAVLAFDGGSRLFPKECAEIRKASDGKPLTLTYQGEVNLTDVGGVGQSIVPDTTSGYYAQELVSVIDDVCAIALSSQAGRAPVAPQLSAGAPRIVARQPGSVLVRVVAGPPTAACGGKQVWIDLVPTAQFGTDYDLPVPTPALFGTLAFTAGFAESGALTSLQYTTAAGAGQALNVLNTALVATQGKTAEQKAADIKAEADLIAQQQRLVQCLADPKSCKP